MKRRSVREEFEEMYIRSKEAERYLKHADTTVLQDPGFKRAIRHVCSRFVRSSGFITFFLKNGFDESDIESVATFIGLTFNGRQAATGENPRNFYLMIRFVAQRMGQFSQFVARKFHSDDAIVVNSEIAIGNAEAPDSYDDNTDDPAPFRGSKKLKAQLKAKLNADPAAYSEQLCSYATAKYVAYDVRQAARAACRRHGIDYKKWLMDKISTGKFDKNEHCY